MIQSRDWGRGSAHPETGVGGGRPGPRQRGYDSTWERLRAKFLKMYPRCAVHGCRRKALHVDHVVPVKVDPGRRLDWYNLQSLCHHHHTQITVAYERGSILGACDKNGLPLDPGHPWAQGDNRAAMQAVLERGKASVEIAAALKRDVFRRSRDRGRG